MTGAAAASQRDRLFDRALGDFVVRERLGEGAFGAVYRAEQPTLHREAVVKVLRAEHESNPVVIERFLREARLASQLDHPFAAHIYAFGAEPDGLLWIAMERVRGTPLDELLRAQGPLPLARFVPLLERLCEVVHAAHEQGIVHRDLKPANVMVVSRAGRLSPKLLDLGIAKLIVDSDGAASSPRRDDDADDGDRPVHGGAVTTGGGLMGSPAYMAPEQWVDPAAVDARTDLYALGVLTYEALTGRRPFVGQTLREIAYAHARQPVPPLGGELPPALDDVLRRALAKAPAERLASAVELAAAVRTAAGFDAEPLTPIPLDEGLRHALVTSAPQPLAEAVAAIEAARNAHQAREALSQASGVAIRWIGLVALAARLHVGDDTTRDRVAAALQTLRRRALTDREWLELARDLCLPFADRPDAHPVPELVAFLAPRDRAQAVAHAELVDAVVALRSSVAEGGSEERVREQLIRDVPVVERFFHEVAFLCDYPLVVPRGDHAERWTGTRRAQRTVMTVRGNALADGRPLLVDPAGCPVVALWPLVQAVAPTPGASDELFLLEGRGRRGARLVAPPLGFERDDDLTWDWLREETRRDSLELGAARQVEELAPYRGLSTFTADDARFFFGRERETEAFMNRLRVTPLLAVVGPSGAGKSSFIQAGVVPLLPDRWCVVTVRPGATPLDSLMAKLVAAGLARGTTATLRDDPAALAADVRAACASRQLTVLVVVDQFEEVFTLCRDASERQVFAEVLAQLARIAEDPVRVIVTLRDDFLIRTQHLAALQHRVPQGLQLLATPGQVELERILVEPARRAGYDFEDPGLPAEMVREILDAPGALALLSFTAAKLWELRDPAFRQLTRRAYRSLGGVGGALSGHADATLASFTAAEQQLVREAFRHLVTAEGTRAVVGRDELEKILGGGASAVSVIERLAAARLIVISEGDRGEDRVEVVHEALLTAWPRLVSWRQEDADGARLRDELRDAAARWEERGRPRGLLWRDDVLVEYKLWRPRYAGRLTDREETFAAASLAEASRGRRARNLAFAGVVAGLVVSVVALTAMNRRTARERAEAEHARRLAQGRLLALYEEQGRQSLLGGDPERALAYLTRAYADGAEGAGLRFLIAHARRQLPPALTSLEGHEDAVRWVAFSPDGTRVATSSADGSARIWRAADGTLERTLAGHEQQVNHAVFSPDGTRLATASRDGTARIWDVGSGETLVVIRGDVPGTAMRVAFSPDGERLIVGGSQGIARLVVARTGATITTLGASPVGVFNPDGMRFAVGTPDGIAEIRDASTGAVVRTLGGHRGLVHMLAWSDDGQLLYTGDTDTVLVWNLANASRVASLRAQRALFVDMDVAGDLVVTTSEDGAVRLWDGPRERLLGLLGTHRGAVMSARFDPEGARFVTASHDGTARVFSSDGRLLSTIMGHDGAVWHAEFSPSGGEIATAGLDRTARLWSSATTRFSSVVRGRAAVFAAVFSPDGAVLATSSEDRATRLVDVTSGHEVAVVRVASPLSVAAFSPDGRRVAVPDGARLRLWDPAGSSAPTFTRAPDGAGTILVAAFSPDGARVAGGAETGVTTIWDAATGEITGRLAGHEGVVTTVSFDGAGRRVVTSSLDGTIKIWDAATGDLERTFPHRGGVFRASLCSDGRRVVTGSTEVSPTVWDVETGARLVFLAGHDNQVFSAAFNHDCTLIATASQDGTVKIWSADDAVLLANLEVPGATWAEFAPGGARLAVTSSDGSITVFDIEPEIRPRADVAAWALCRNRFAVENGKIVPHTPPKSCKVSNSP